MEATLRPRVKVCCIASEAEAWTAVRCGAAALGLVSAMPSGPGPIAEAEIARIARIVPPPVAAFLLTCRQDAEGILAQQRRTGVGTLQLCDALPTQAYAELRTALPGVRLVQVIHVEGEAALGEAEAVAPHVDALLLDSGRPSLPVKELGGTGRVHDWTVSRAIRERVTIPVFLAGGLTPENVADAVRQVGPFGVDLCTGVRTDGRLDEAKLRRFFTALEGG